MPKCKAKVLNSWIGKTAEIFLKDVEVAGKDTTVIRLKAVQ